MLEAVPALLSYVKVTASAGYLIVDRAVSRPKPARFRYAKPAQLGSSFAAALNARNRMQNILEVI